MKHPVDDDELDAIRQAHRRFASAELEGDSAARDRKGEFSLERWRAAAEFGLLGICMPVAYGGQGKPVSHAIAAYEGLGRGCHDGGFVYALCSQLFGVQMVLQLCASEALKRGYLPRLIRGELLAANGFTERASGSDAFSMQTRAVEDGDSFVLNGNKCFITNAPVCQVALVFAKTLPERNPFGLTAFLVDMSWDGAGHGESFEKLGLRTVPMGELTFAQVRVPKDHVVASVGSGLTVLAEAMSYERAMLLATALGPMSRAIDECIERARTRKQFDKPIGAFQGTAHRIANMIMRRRLCALAIYDMARKAKDGVSLVRYAQESAITKLFVSEQFIETEMDAMHVFGARGYLLDHFAQQDLRDALSSTIWAGTDETLRNTIAKLAGLPVM
jgi:alkylation response protein AidB-like acyl-CoA dehydrogenase